MANLKRMMVGWGVGGVGAAEMLTGPYPQALKPRKSRKFVGIRWRWAPSTGGAGGDERRARGSEAFRGLNAPEAGAASANLHTYIGTPPAPGYSKFNQIIFAVT